MKRKSKGGFTLLELLVVIALLAIFAAIVLASLSSARKKGEDASIQATMKNIQTQASLYYSQNGNYGIVAVTCGAVGSMFSDTTPYGLSNLVTGGQFLTNNLACFSSGVMWVISAELKSDSTKYWCVDSSGISKKRTAAATSTESLCGGY